MKNSYEGVKGRGGQNQEKTNPTAEMCRKLEESNYYEAAEFGRMNNLEDMINDFDLSNKIKNLAERGEIVPGDINILLAGSASSLNALALAGLIYETGIDAGGNKALIVDMNMTPLHNQKYANNFIRLASLIEGVNFQTEFYFASMDLQNSAIADNSIDILLSDFTLVFCEDEECFKKSLSNMHRVLKDNGRAFVNLRIQSGNDEQDLIKENGMFGLLPSESFIRKLIKESDLQMEVLSEKENNDNTKTVRAVLTKA